MQEHWGGRKGTVGYHCRLQELDLLLQKFSRGTESHLSFYIKFCGFGGPQDRRWRESLMVCDSFLDVLKDKKKNKTLQIVLDI